MKCQRPKTECPMRAGKDCMRMDKKCPKKEPKNVRIK